MRYFMVRPAELGFPPQILGVIVGLPPVGSESEYLTDAEKAREQLLVVPKNWLATREDLESTAAGREALERWDAGDDSLLLKFELHRKAISDEDESLDDAAWEEFFLLRPDMREALRERRGSLLAPLTPIEMETFEAVDAIAARLRLERLWEQS